MCLLIVLNQSKKLASLQRRNGLSHSDFLPWLDFESEFVTVSFQKTEGNLTVRERDERALAE